KKRESELIALSRSTWGDRDTTRWIDDDTGLPVGTAAEAYLAAACERRAEGLVSVLALAVDRIDALAAARGPEAKRQVVTRVAQAVGMIGAPIGVLPAIYPDGVIVFVAPRLPAVAAKTLGQALLSTVASLGIANSEAIASSRATASIGVVTAFNSRTELIADA